MKVTKKDKKKKKPRKIEGHQERKKTEKLKVTKKDKKKKKQRK